jgi:predicted SPOUT superfamily RNA methylase MTH1
LNRKTLCVAIPASVVSDTPHLREVTSKIGLIGRAAAIFRVGEIIIYPDEPSVDQSAETRKIALLLAYMETPQYLRKRLFRLEPELRYAGILPPLRTPHHPLNRRMRNLKVGECREGVTLSRTGEGTLVDIGVEQPALLPNMRLSPRKRVTVRVVAKAQGRVEIGLTSHDEVPDYWGYIVNVEKRSLGDLLKTRRFDLTIATSKHGVPFAEVAEKIAVKWKRAELVLVAFGAPAEGLNEILAREGLKLSNVMNFVVNTVPMQATATVRTEEALLASLALLNFCYRQ